MFIALYELEGEYNQDSPFYIMFKPLYMEIILFSFYIMFIDLYTGRGKQVVPPLYNVYKHYIEMKTRFPLLCLNLYIMFIALYVNWKGK